MLTLFIRALRLNYVGRDLDERMFLILIEFFQILTRTRPQIHTYLGRSIHLEEFRAQISSYSCFLETFHTKLRIDVLIIFFLMKNKECIVIPN